jgi:hypothetical protein
VTARLRELFEEMLRHEPPLHTTAESAAADGRRIVRRSQTLWTIAGTAILIALVAMLPGAWGANRREPAADGPTVDEPTADGPPTGPTPGPTALTLQGYWVCPSATPPAQGDASLLPDPQVAMSALLAAAAQIAPALTFIARSADHPSPHRVAIVADIGDIDGYGALNVEMYPDDGGPPAQRAAAGAMVSSCVDGSRCDFPDGSVALYYPQGPPEQEAVAMHVWYYAVAGFTMNIGLFPQPSDSSPLPARGTMPLAIDQVMLLADAVARAA